MKNISCVFMSIILAMHLGSSIKSIDTGATTHSDIQAQQVKVNDLQAEKDTLIQKRDDAPIPISPSQYQEYRAQRDSQDEDIKRVQEELSQNENILTAMKSRVASLPNSNDNTVSIPGAQDLVDKLTPETVSQISSSQLEEFITNHREEFLNHISPEIMDRMTPLQFNAVENALFGPSEESLLDARLQSLPSVQHAVAILLEADTVSLIKPTDLQDFLHNNSSLFLELINPEIMQKMTQDQLSVIEETLFTTAITSPEPVQDYRSQLVTEAYNRIENTLNLGNANAIAAGDILVLLQNRPTDLPKLFKPDVLNRLNEEQMKLIGDVLASQSAQAQKNPENLTRTWAAYAGLAQNATQELKNVLDQTSERTTNDIRQSWSRFVAFYKPFVQGTVDLFDTLTLDHFSTYKLDIPVKIVLISLPYAIAKIAKSAATMPLTGASALIGQMSKAFGAGQKILAKRTEQ